MIYISIDENRHQTGFFGVSSPTGIEAFEVKSNAPDWKDKGLESCYFLKENYEFFTAGEDQWELDCVKDKDQRVNYEVNSWIEFRDSINKEILDATIDNDDVSITALTIEKNTEKLASERRIQDILDEVI